MVFHSFFRPHPTLPHPRCADRAKKVNNNNKSKNNLSWTGGKKMAFIFFTFSLSLHHTTPHTHNQLPVTSFAFC